MRLEHIMLKTPCDCSQRGTIYYNYKITVASGALTQAVRDSARRHLSMVSVAYCNRPVRWTNGACCVTGI